MKTNIAIDVSPLFPYLAKFCFSSYGPKCCSPIKLQGSLKCNISRKKRIMKFIFGIQINIEVFYKLTTLLWVCIACHSQSTQNNKFAISLQYLKENMKDKIDFFPVDAHIVLSFCVCGQACPNYPK